MNGTNSTTVGRVAPASIQHLSNEILLRIFRHLYFENRLPRYWVYGTTEWKDEELDWEDCDLSSPTVFPYAPALVCSRWSRVLSEHPLFWTRVVIAIDDDERHRKMVSESLSWSKDRLIEIEVVRRSYSHNKDHAGETAMVNQIMPCIVQHLHRCQSICFKLIYTSSFPDLRKWFRGDASSLNSLELKSDIEDQTIVDRPSLSGSKDRFRFATPKLRNLQIDGTNFHRACIIRSTWIANAYDLSHITIDAPIPSSSPQKVCLRTTLKVLSELPHLSSLVVRGLTFTAPRLNGNSQFTLAARHVVLEGLGGNAVAHFIHALDYPRDICITRCSLAQVSFFPCRAVTLEDIDEEWELWPPLANSTITELTLTLCPGFNDEILDSLTWVGPKGTEVYMRDL
ncbi:hypothetical protein HYDPIDRAFT_190588 [Hydnomerulius pinastri MD-312]|uniref:F-box domain-containing protein n=1 Tax=Hydnomerulius pinastri MD-312 TaxID=994086 RepID=A0A0C9VNR2_9AGAM|nr:hypothetical protein HYDPIDRAFT_190588 [Hydnomerulius pinastri MD-312]